MDSIIELSEADLNDKQKASLERILLDAKQAMIANTAEPRQTIQNYQQQRTEHLDDKNQPEKIIVTEKITEKPITQQKQINKTAGQKKGALKKVLISTSLIVFLSIAGLFAWYFWWTSQASFEFKLQPVVILEGQQINPDDFLAPAENPDRISIVFRDPLFKPATGSQEVNLTIIRGRSVVESSSPLYILTAFDQITHEFGEAGSKPQPTDLFENASIIAGVPVDMRFTVEPMPLEDYPVGEHILSLTLNDTPFEVLLIVEDTKPPEADQVDLTIMIGEEVRPEDFVTNITDASDHLPISITYHGPYPDIFGQNQIITIDLKDYYDNYTRIQSKLTVLHNTAEPTIVGAETIFINIGDPISYMTGVKAYDDFGRDITDMIKIDDFGVNPNETGLYTVLYMVTDLSGLTAELIVPVHVTDAVADFVNEKVDYILAGIINDEMTQLQKVRSIFSWIRSNVFYSISKETIESPYAGAYRALRELKGDSYIFSSISKIMFDRADIPNLLIERYPDEPASHRWNLINPDNSGWHHYDSFPSPFNAGIQKAFFTDTQATEFSRQLSTDENRTEDNYYSYNFILYPQIVE